MPQNENGSVTLYVRAEAPADSGSNWIPKAGNLLYLIFRSCGPGEAFCNKMFKLADVDLLEYFFKHISSARCNPERSVKQGSSIQF